MLLWIDSKYNNIYGLSKIEIYLKIYKKIILYY